MHIPAHRADDHGALARGIRLLHVGFEEGDGRLHHLGRLEHERQLHLAAAEALADDLHASEEVVVDDRQRTHAVGAGKVEVGLEALRLAVDDAALEPLSHRQRGQFGGTLVLERR